MSIFRKSRSLLQGFPFLLALGVCIAVGSLDDVATAADQIVDNTASSGAGSLPYAVENVGDGQNVIFGYNVIGGVISLPSLSIERSMNFVNNTGEGGEVVINYSGGAAWAMPITDGSTVSIDSGLIFSLINTSHGGVLYGEKLSLGKINATLNVTGARAYVICSNSDDLTMASFDGQLSATGNNTAYGIYSNSNLYVTGAFTGSVLADTSTGVAYGIYASSDIEFSEGLNGSITAKSVGSTAAAVFSNLGDITVDGTVGAKLSARSTQGMAAAIAASNGNIDLRDGLSGTISACGTTAYGIRSRSDLSFGGDYSGKITTTGADYAAALYSFGGDVDFAGNLGGEITATATGDTGSSYGIIADQGYIDIAGKLSGSIIAEAVREANGLKAYGDISIANGISGKIKAIATDSEQGYSYGIRTDGILNGEGASRPLVIKDGGSVISESAYSATGIECWGFHIKVDKGGTLKAYNTTSDEPGTAIYSSGNNEDKLSLVAGCTIIGDIFCGSGNDTITLSGSASNSTTIDGNEIASAETINVTGGNWSFNGDITGTSAINMTAGSFSLNGTATGSTLTIGEGCTLGGNGTYADLINRGTLAPGNSIGTVTVTGDFTSAASSQMLIEINGNGQSDLIAVTGAATLNGGVVSVAAENGSYNDSDTYTFLTANGGVNGESLTVVNNMNVFDTELEYYGQHVTVRLIAAYDSEAETLNQTAVAQYLNAHSAGASGDFQTVLDQFNTLSGPEAREAFDEMGGEIFGSLSTIGIENQERFMRLISQRIRARHLLKGLGYASNDDSYRNGDVQYVCNCCEKKCSGWQPWFEGYGVAGRIAGNEDSLGMSYSTGGLAVGLERQLTHNTLLGVVGGYSSSYANQVGSTNRGAIDGGQAAVYLHRDTDRFYTTGIAAYGYNTYDTHRRINFGTIDRTADANYCGNNASFLLEIGRNVFFNRFNMQPYAGLEYIQLHQNDFVETGAGSIDIAVDGIRADAFRGLLGSRFVLDYELDNARLLTLEGRAAWRHEFLNDNRIVDATFAGQAGTAFAVAGVNVDRDAGILGLGLSSRLCTGLTIFAGYDVLVSENYTAHAGSGGVQYVW